MSLPGFSLLQQLRRVLAGAGLGFRAWSFRFLASAFTDFLRFRIWDKGFQEFGFSGLVESFPIHKHKERHGLEGQGKEYEGTAGFRRSVQIVDFWIWVAI